MSQIETNVIKPEIKFFENDKENLLISNEVESNLEGKIEQIESYMKNTVGKGKTQEEKDAIYGQAQILWKEYSIALKGATYNFHLNKEQWNFLTNLLIKKLEYDVNTVFFAIELTDMLGSMNKAKYSNDKELISFPVNTTEITYIYHLISKHTVKGLTRDSYTFTQILKRIGDISKVFNYYDATAKSLATDVQDWVALFEDGVTSDTESVQATVIEPATN